MMKFVPIVVMMMVTVEGAMPRRGKDAPCATKCEARDCKNALGLRWGKYCGMGHTGCIEQKEIDGKFKPVPVEPCDAYDKCCMGHDDCVGKKGMLNTGCHNDLKTCLANAIEANEKTWQETQKIKPTCEAKDLVATMTGGMNIANMFSDSFNKNKGNKVKVDKKKVAPKDPAYGSKENKKQPEPKKATEQRKTQEESKKPAPTPAEEIERRTVMLKEFEGTLEEMMAEQDKLLTKQEEIVRQISENREEIKDGKAELSMMKAELEKIKKNDAKSKSEEL
eukprot:TRINITY_DN9644_c0_g1_i1.p1 TRINITY_DN9644_c0_g1~~TRINITY_DN9644_c0_g1_i1.p1  ORF type:complete len:295 (+),score=97.19 TRINITY_DN9644_c0_g1_i1:51-887(+)